MKRVAVVFTETSENSFILVSATFDLVQLNTIKMSTWTPVSGAVKYKLTRHESIVR